MGGSDITQLHWFKATCGILRLYRNVERKRTGSATLHVDDVLATAAQNTFYCLKHDVEKLYGKMKQNSGEFRHFGVDFAQTHDSDISMFQRNYLQMLTLVQIQKVRGDGHTIDFSLIDEEPMNYCSVTCGIAWVSVEGLTPEAASS